MHPTTKLQTETLNKQAQDLDVLPAIEILSILHHGQVAAAKSVSIALPSIETAAQELAMKYQKGGRLVYAAAGSSALMGLADGLELPGTFSIPKDRIEILVAGGDASLSDLQGGPEDDSGLGEADIENANITACDSVICLSASGSTPYTLGALKAAKKMGARSIGIANNAGSKLLEEADIGIFLPTPPEIIAGSTRMGAGTAQKITLNMMSTLMAVHLGHIYDGQMVNVTADNQKLRNRAHTMIATITECSNEKAKKALDRANGSVKLAILLAAGAKDADTAKTILESNGDKLRPSLSALKLS